MPNLLLIDRDRVLPSPLLASLRRRPPCRHCRRHTRRMRRRRDTRRLRHLGITALLLIRPLHHLVMDLDMLQQIIPPAEPLPTSITEVRLFLCMRAHVSLEMFESLESLAARLERTMEDLVRARAWASRIRERTGRVLSVFRVMVRLRKRPLRGDGRYPSGK